MPEPVMARRYMFWCLSAAFRNRASLWAFLSAETRGIHDRTYDSNIMTQIGWFYSRRTSESSESRALTRGDTLSLGPGDQALISTMWPLTACPLKMQCDIFTASVSIWHRETRTFETEHVPVQKNWRLLVKGFEVFYPSLIPLRTLFGLKLCLPDSFYVDLCVWFCSAYCCALILHGSDECNCLSGAGAHRLRPTVSEHTGHWRLVSQTEHTLVLKSRRD